MLVYREIPYLASAIIESIRSSEVMQMFAAGYPSFVREADE